MAISRCISIFGKHKGRHFLSKWLTDTLFLLRSNSIHTLVCLYPDMKKQPSSLAVLSDIFRKLAVIDDFYLGA